ncbi:MAG: glycosyl transferase, partial [Pseudomonadota bacterium]
PAAGKTGTTQGARDAWFIGFTGQYVAGVWMGYDDNRPLTGVTGGGLPAVIWQETMARVHQGLPIVRLPTAEPPGRIRVAGGGGAVPRAPVTAEEEGSLISRVIEGLLSGGDATPRPRDERPDR